MARIGTLIMVVCLAATMRGAAVVWEFDDAEGTVMSAVKGAPDEGRWSADLGESVTTGQGTLRLRNIDTEKCRSFFRIPTVKKNETVWLVLNIARWQFIDGSLRSVSVGLAQSPDPKFHAVAEINLQGSADRGFFAAGAAVPGKEGAKGTKAIRIGGDTGDSPLVLALEFLSGSKSFNIYRGGADGKLALLGSGKTSNRREARYAYIYIRNAFGAVKSEYLEISGLAVTTARQIPNFQK